MITINFANMMSDSVNGGLTIAEIDSLKDRLGAVHRAVSGRKHHELYFLDLASQSTEEIDLMGESIRSNSDYFLILGIGGSALGPRSLLEALKPFYNQKHAPKIFISTVETMASFLILMRAMKEAHGDKFAKRIIATTDPEKGLLREIAKKENFNTLPVHENVVGRYSVLSPVGLLLGAVAGINIKGLLKGSRDMLKKCSAEDIWGNPAYMTSALMYLIGEKKKKDISVLLPYSDRLKSFSEWYCQLWAESLGKDNAGQTPYPAIGTTDQHSQLQLWIEGPKDKVITFLRIEDFGSDIAIVDEDIPSMNYLKNHSLKELINAEQEATELSLLKAGIPNMRLNVPMIDAYYMGQLFMFFEIVTAVTGMLYGINPFTQPAVEEGKNLTYGIMGRKGYEAKAAEVTAYRGKIKDSKYKID
ncbi:MAG: glucose-6-phosphate isomerase [Nitrospirae bacterium]|nr:glucose-6-phosphate isomerase [Nitrospirota bacterium]